MGYLICYPVPIYLLSVPPVSVVSLGISPLPWDPVAAGLPDGSSIASKPYLRRASVP